MIKRTSTSKNDRIKLIHSQAEVNKLKAELDTLKAQLNQNKGESPKPTSSVDLLQEVKSEQPAPSNTPVGDNNN